LAAIYCIVWLDGIVFKVRHNGKVINKTIYLAVGLNTKGKKELLGLWLAETKERCFLDERAHRYQSPGCRGSAHHLP
jgi:putative transposase